MFKLEVASNDIVALRAFSKAFDQMARDTIALDNGGHMMAVEATFTKPLPADDQPVAVTEQVNTESAIEEQLLEELPEDAGFGEESPVSNIEELEPDYDVEPAIIPDVGSDGIPWDSRIHSAQKSTIGDGTFRLKRKPKESTDAQWEQYVAAVKAELKQLMAIPVAPIAEQAAAVVLQVTPDEQVSTVAPPPPAVDVVVPPPPAVEQAAVVVPPPPAVEQAAAVVPPPPAVEQAAAVVPPPTTAGTVVTFADFMKFCTSNNKTLTADTVKTVCQKHGVGSVPLLTTRLDLIPQIHSELMGLL